MGGSSGLMASRWGRRLWIFGIEIRINQVQARLRCSGLLQSGAARWPIKSRSGDWPTKSSLCRRSEHLRRSSSWRISVIRYVSPSRRNGRLEAIATSSSTSILPPSTFKFARISLIQSADRRAYQYHNREQPVCSHHHHGTETRCQN